MFTYVINGIVLPERASVSISNIGLKTQIPTLSDKPIDFNISIQVSQISIVIQSEQEIKDFETLKNYTQDFVAMTLDIYGYLSGRGYDVEITSLTNPPSNQNYIFGVGVYALEINENKRPKSYNEIIQLFKGNIKFEQQLRLALLNFRLAIRSASDTGFHCYRAIEAMAQSFKISSSTELASKDWDEFKNKLNIDNKWIMKMKNDHADQQRHGNSTYMSGNERVDMLKNTQEVIDKFILFISNIK